MSHYSILRMNDKVFPSSKLRENININNTITKNSERITSTKPSSSITKDYASVSPRKYRIANSVLKSISFDSGSDVEISLSTSTETRKNAPFLGKRPEQTKTLQIPSYDEPSVFIDNNNFKFHGDSIEKIKIQRRISEPTDTDVDHVSKPPDNDHGNGLKQLSVSAIPPEKKVRIVSSSKMNSKRKVQKAQEYVVISDDDNVGIETKLTNIDLRAKKTKENMSSDAKRSSELKRSSRPSKQNFNTSHDEIIDLTVSDNETIPSPPTPPPLPAPLLKYDRLPKIEWSTDEDTPEPEGR